MLNILSKLISLFLVGVVAWGCAEPMDEADFLLEASQPAAWYAGNYDGLDAPVDFGFQPVETADLPNFPRWYCPKSVITRSQLASFIVRSTRGANAPLADYDVSFSDVATGNVHSAEIEQAVHDGIMGACGDGAFCPDNGVTRGQMATYLMRAMRGADFEPPAATGIYSDVDTSHPHAAAIEQLNADGLAPDCGERMYCPDSPMTREQVATFLVRAKYQQTPRTAPSGTFRDVAATNPHASNIETLVADGVTFGCEAPAIGFRVEGYPLTRLQRNWMLYFAGEALPRLAVVYGSEERALEVASRAIWWSLKEGVFGEFSDPFRHSICHLTNGDLKHLGAFETCSGDWQFGLVASEIPDVREDEVRSAASSIYPGRTEDQVAIDLVSLGRELSRITDAGDYPHDAEDKVLNDTLLRRSWLARDPAIGTYAIIDDIERDCVVGEAQRCFSSMPESSRRFASSKAIATRVQLDIRRILESLAPR